MKQIKLILSAMVLLLIISGCGIFKKRQVHVATVDSTTKATEQTQVKEQSSHVDTGSKKTIITQHSTDSSTTTTTITPVPNKPFVVDPDGTYHGEASNVTSTTTKKHTGDKNNTTDEKKGISDTSAKDSVVNKAMSTTYHAKVKDVVSTPDYKWIWYVAAILAVLGIGLWLYKKYL